MLLVQSNGAANSGSSGTISFTSNVTAGDLLLVVFLPFNANPPAPTDSLSNTWIPIVPFAQESSGAAGMNAWAAIANSSGACTVSYSGFPSADQAAIFLEEWSGVEALSHAGSAIGTGSTTICENTNTPLTTQSGTAVLFAWQDSNGNAITPSPGTSRQAFSIPGGAYATLADAPFSIQSSFAAFSVTWSIAGGGGADTVCGMIFLFGPASGGSAANSSFAA